MAKLNGVKVIDMKNGEVTKISYEGEEYAKVDDGSNGDIGLRVGHELPTIVTVGGYYRIAERSGSNKLGYYGNSGRYLTTDNELNFVYFRKVGTPDGDGYVKVGRKPRVGDYVKFDEDSSYIDNDKYYEIIGFDSFGDAEFIDEDGDRMAVAGRTYEVYEKCCAGESDVLPEGTKVRGIYSGDIYTIINRRPEFDSTRLGTAYNTDDGGWICDKQFTVVTDEEIQRMVDGAKWAEIGRKVYEYKEGDIVTGTRGLDNSREFLGEVEDIGGFLIGVRELGDITYHTSYKSRCQLIAPVEARFDK